MYVRDSLGRLVYRDTHGQLWIVPPQASGFDPFVDIGGGGGTSAMPHHAAQVRQNVRKEAWNQFNAPPPGDQMHYQPEHHHQHQQQNSFPVNGSAPPMSMGHMIAISDPRFFNHQGSRVINRSSPPVMINPGDDYEPTAAQPSCMNTIFGAQVKNGNKKKTSVSDVIMACNQVDPPTTDTDFDINMNHFGPSTTSTSRLGNAMQAFHCNGVRGPGRGFLFNGMKNSNGDASPADDISLIMDMDMVVAVPPQKSRKKKAKEFSKTKEPLGEIQEKDSDYESAEETFEPAQQHQVQPKVTLSSEDSKDAVYSEVVSKPRRSKKQRDVTAGPMIELSKKPEMPPTMTEMRNKAPPSPMPFPSGSSMGLSTVSNVQQQVQPSYSAAMYAFQQGQSDLSDEAVASIEATGMEAKMHSRTTSRQRESKSKTSVLQPSAQYGFSAQDQAELVKNIRQICLHATPELGLELNGEEYPSFDEQGLKPKPEERTSSPELSEFSSGNGENKQPNKKKKKKKTKTKEKNKKERKGKKRKKKRAAAAERERALSVMEAPK